MRLTRDAAGPGTRLPDTWLAPVSSHPARSDRFTFEGPAFINKWMPEGKGAVLVVDDDADHRMVLRTLLADTGVQVLEARDGFQALEVRAGAQTPLLVVCDHRMPGPTGVQTITRMAADRRPGERFVLMSSFVSDGMLREALLAGADDVVEKPLMWEDLLVIVTRLVADWRASHAFAAPMAVASVR